MTNPEAGMIFGNENRGWVGDVPIFSYNTDKLKNLGWKKKLSSEDAVSLAIKEIYIQER